MIPHPKLTCRRCRGAAAVEFALVAPVFLVFLFGTIELGRLALSRNVLANASREAARLAIIEGSTDEEIKAVARQYAEAGSVTGVDVDVTRNNADATASVTVSISFEDVSWLPNAWFLKDQVLSQTTTMRMETIEVSSYDNNVDDDEVAYSGNG